MSDVPAQPAWPTAAAAAPPRRSGPIELKLVIAVLIGLVSVTGAIMAWRSSQLGENATDKDRQAIAETVRAQQDEANDEITFQDARSRASAFAASVASADILEEQAGRFADAGDDASARQAADEAEEQRQLADSYLLGGPAALDLTDYVVDDGTGALVLDEGRLRDDLAAVSQAENQVNPGQTVRDANRLRAQSQHFDGWIVPLVGAVVILTLAQISRQRVLRLALTAAATVVWVVSAALGFGGA